MTVIRIREQRKEANSFAATVSFDDQYEYSITVSDPFSPEEEARLEWYFEQHLKFPFMDDFKAQEAAASIAKYGEVLFGQVFSGDAKTQYRMALQNGGPGALSLEIAGSPEFHRLHWEALKDPRFSDALAVHAPVVRKSLTPPPLRANVRSLPTLNVLVVTARPHGHRDVGYRTISRPLVEALRQTSLRVQIEILRPGSYRALKNHLEEARDRHGVGYYQLIHFDVHGMVAAYEALQQVRAGDRFVFQARYGRADIQPYRGQKAFLFLEGEGEAAADPVEAQELTDLLLAHQIPVAILNACQSGKQVGAEETSLGSRLMQAGMQTVLAMGYSVTVSAAELLMRTLYEQLFAGHDLPVAIRRGRAELHSHRDRRAYYNRTIELEDWLLPVVYQNQPVRLAVRELTPDEARAYYERQAQPYTVPQPTYGFVGRDLDVLQIEKRLLARRNLLLVRGMGGAGKTTLLHHLAMWWQTTKFVEQVYYFGYDEKAWNCQQMLAAIGERLLSKAEYYGTFQPLSLPAQQAFVAERLRAQRYLLILDNLESVTGAPLAIQNTLSPDQQAEVRGFLARLTGGKTLVLLGSRGGEEWLAHNTFGDNVYELPGLDPEAASTLAERILERHHATRYRQDAQFLRLLKLLDGYPLALEVVLTNLTRQTPAEVLAALQAGDVNLDTTDSQKKTESILRCIDYSHSNLSPDAQGLLACLAPFSGVIWAQLLPQYTAQLKQQPALAHLPFERWPEVLQEAANWGLLSPEPDNAGFLHLQPIFPYFLRSRLQTAEQAEMRRAVETVFREHYDQLSDALSQLMQSKEPQEKQLGQVLVGIEYENIATALNLALQAKVSMFRPYAILSDYLSVTRKHQQGLILGEWVFEQFKAYTAQVLAETIKAELVVVVDRMAGHQLSLKMYPQAEASYQKALGLHEGLSALDAGEKRRRKASLLHQLGVVAQEQRQWEQAEQYYRQVLTIKVESNDFYGQASTLHQLGMVAEEQRQWEQAERFYQQTLEIYEKFEDYYGQASALHQLGVVAQKQQQWTRAELRYQQELAIYEKFKDWCKRAPPLHQLGMIAEERQQWAKAEQYYQLALEIAVGCDDWHGQTKPLHQLGIVAEKQQRWEQAEQYYQKELAIYVEFNDRYGQALPLYQLGMVAQDQQRWGKAWEYLLRALKIALEYQDGYHLAMILGNLMCLWQASADETLPAAMARALQVTEQEARELLRMALGERE